MSNEGKSAVMTPSGVGTSSGNVGKTKLPITKADKQEFKSASAERFSLSDLSPRERDEAEDIAAAAGALAMKGLLHRLDPKKYPVPANILSLEARAAHLASEIPVQVFNRLRPGLEKAVTEPKKIARLVGKLKHVDFHKADLTADFGRLTLKPSPQPPPAGEMSTQGSGPKYNRLDLLLRKLHCVDETDPEGGDDDMILGGVMIGASGRVKVPKAFVAGHFDDGDVQNFGELFFGQYSLNTTSSYPKSFYCIFKLVESDSDDKEVAESLTATLSFIANVILSAFVSTLVGQTAGAVIQAIGGFFSGLIDEDEFPPYGIRLKMNSENTFGGSESGTIWTEEIRAHGGRYRIAYKWSLNA